MTALPLIMLALAAAALPSVAAQGAGLPAKIILDTDIGDDIDDAYALALAARHPGAQLMGVTTAFGETAKRQALAAKLLAVMGRGDVPVAAGRPGPAAAGPQCGWAAGFRSRAMRAGGAVRLMKQVIDRHPGEITLIAIGALTNVADLIRQHPDVRTKVRCITIMGGAAYVGYDERPPVVVEWNIKCDPEAARTVFESGIPVVMAGLDVTTMMRFDLDRQKRLFGAGSPVTDALAALTTIWGGGSAVPVLYDAVAVAWALGDRHCEAEERRVEVTPEGITRLVDGKPNTTVLVRPRRDEFLDWYVTAIQTALRQGGGR